MPKSLRPYWKAELERAKEFFASGNLHGSWNHLERAHVIGQAYPYEHSWVHWKMLMFGFRTKNTKEIIGQLPRLLVGGVKSFVGKIPVGNTGGANVPPLRPMPIEKDIRAILQNNTY